jgi:FtsP/CotA-like multicopper oxidase with cupredoxin domain
MNHPFHLHGQAFYVVDMAQYAEGQTAQELLNFLNSNVKRMSPAPALKDTIAVPSGGYAVMKLRANNPGKPSLSIHWNSVW